MSFFNKNKKKSGMRKVLKLVTKIAALFAGGGGVYIAITPILLAAFVIFIGAAGAMQLLSEEELGENEAKCTCYHLSEEEIRALEAGNTIQIQGGGAVTITPDGVISNTGFSNANISGGVQSGTWANDAYWLTKALQEKFGPKVPLWVIYGINSVETSGSLSSVKTAFANGTYSRLDSQLTKWAREDYDNGASGLFQVEYNTSKSVSSLVEPIKAEVETLLSGLGYNVGNYPGMNTNCYEYKALGFRNWYQDPMYVPTSIIGVVSKAVSFEGEIDKSAIMSSPEFSTNSEAEKQFIRNCYLMSCWNNGGAYLNNSGYKSSKSDANVRKYFSAFAKLMADSAFITELSSTSLSSGGNAEPEVKNFVIEKAVSKGYLTSADKTAILSIPYSNGDGTNGYQHKDWRNREMHYITNGIYNCLTSHKANLAKAGITVSDWGFFSGTASAVSTQSSTSLSGSTQPESTVGGNTLKLNYTADNYEKGFSIQPQYTLPDCAKITLKKQLVPSSTAKGTRPYINGIVVHYTFGGGATADNIYSTFSSSPDGTSDFGIGIDGTLNQMHSFDLKYNTQNDQNSYKLAIEAANSDGTTLRSGGAYSQATYNTLVHLVAYLAVELNLSLDFNFSDNPKGNEYWDTSALMRHYDCKKSNTFRGKGCPFNWVPNDGSVETATGYNGEIMNQMLVDGGQSRWISFKTEVIKFILAYKDHPNFAICFDDGTEMVGLDWARQHSKGTFDWRSPEVAGISNIVSSDGSSVGMGAGSTSSVGNSSSSIGGYVGAYSYLEKPVFKDGRKFLPQCGIDSKGYCGCYAASPECVCGCGGKVDVLMEKKTTTITGDGTSNLTGGETGQTYFPIDSSNGLPVPAQRIYTLEDITSTGAQRVLDTALVVYQGWYAASKDYQGSAPLYTQNTKTGSYDYSSLTGQPYTNTKVSIGKDRRDCSLYTGTVLKSMGVVCGLNNTSSKNWWSDGLTGFTNGSFAKKALASYPEFEVILNPSYDDFRPGDFITRSGHCEIFVGWENRSTNSAYVYSWGGSQRLSQYPGDSRKRGDAKDTGEVNLYPKDATSTFITGYRAKTLTHNYKSIIRYNGTGTTTAGGIESTATQLPIAQLGNGS